MNINDIKAERAKVWEQMKALLDTAEAENRDFSSEERESYERMESDLDVLGQRAQRMESAAKIEADIAATADIATRSEAKVNPLEDFLRGRTNEYELRFSGAKADAIAAQYRWGKRQNEFRDLGRTTATDGAELVPTDFAGRLYEHLIENTAIRQCGTTVLTTANGNDLDFPKTTAHSSAALFGEGATITESDPQFATMTLNAWKYGVSFQVSSELLQDEQVNLVGYLARQAGQAIANAAGAHFVTGDGSSKPNGVVTAATVGHTAAATNAITGEDLIDLFHSVIPAYRRNACWIMDDATAGHVRKIRERTDTTPDGGNFLWQPGLQAGQPDLLLGRPVVIDTNVASIATTAKPIAFGDFSAYYIRDVGSVRFERSDDFAFDKDLATFRALWRTDGDLIDTTAVKTLQMA